MVICIDDVNWSNYKFVEMMSPFGVGNEKPVFLFKNVKIHELKQFGKEKNHLEIMLKGENGKKIPAIGFFSHSESYGTKIFAGDSIDLLATMEKSTFRNFPELRLRIVDIF